MTYYEELGVSPTATAEEIRRAYRQISKIYHPDIQTDDNVRQVAEIQQKRLNSIVATLTNPEERRLYDASLLQDSDAAPLSAAPLAPPHPASFDVRVPPPPPYGVSSARRQTYMWLALFALPIIGSGLFWWITERNIVGVPVGGAGASPAETTTAASSDAGSTSAKSSTQSRLARFPNANVPDTAARSSDFLPPPAPLYLPGYRPAANTPPATVTAVSSAPIRSLTPAPAVSTPAPEMAPPPAIASNSALPAAPRINLPNHAPATAPPPAVEKSNSSTRQTNTATPPPPPSPPPARVETASVVVKPIPPAAVPPIAPAGLSGTWVYLPASNNKSVNRAIYPPEFIELSLQENRGSVKGSYHSRYRITDKPVPPEVNFQFHGGERGPQQFAWKTADGTRGQVRLEQLTANTIQVDWYVTQFGRSPGLASGSAVLTRRP